MTSNHMGLGPDNWGDGMHIIQGLGSDELIRAGYGRAAAPAPAPAPAAAPPKCDGDHGGPPCADPECWARPAAPVQWGDLIRRLQVLLDDPMWADHAGISKATLRAAIAALSHPAPGAPQQEASGAQPLEKLFTEAMAWGRAYGAVMGADLWDEMRDDMSKQFASRAAPAAPAVEAVTDERALNALAELVSVKDLKERTEALYFAGPTSEHGEGWKAIYETQRKEYLRRQPAAWAEARELLALARKGGAK